MGQFRSFITWYRLKSDQKHLYLKLDGEKFLDEQPVSLEDAELLAEETIEATKEMHEILATDNRILVIKLDLRRFSYLEFNTLPGFKYLARALRQGMDLDYIEVQGAGEYWTYISSFLPKTVRAKIVLK